MAGRTEQRRTRGSAIALWRAAVCAMLWGVRLIPRQRRPAARILRLWPLGLVLALTLLAAVVAAAAVFYTGWGLLGVKGLKPEAELSSTTLFDLVKISFGVVAGAGALVALVVAYRKQRVNEADALRETTRLHTERFTAAVTQLGDNSAAVRLGGVHALAGLADDAPTRDLRQTGIDVLCAYLRLPYTAEADIPEEETGARHDYLALREVRHTIIRLIRDHFRLPKDDPHSWLGHDLDLTAVVFDGGDLTDAVFSGGRVSFAGATFSGKVSFTGAVFSGGLVDFEGAVFSGGLVNFREAVFSGGLVNFREAVFSGGLVNFHGAVFSDGLVNFREATFSDGLVNFGRVTFSGSLVTFHGATFSGGTVDFRVATFPDGRPTFSGCTVDFRVATFSGGTVDFSTARGATPVGVVPTGGAPVPEGLVLPAMWLPSAPDGPQPDPG